MLDIQRQDQEELELAEELRRYYFTGSGPIGWRHTSGMICGSGSNTAE